MSNAEADEELMWNLLVSPTQEHQDNNPNLEQIIPKLEFIS